MTVTTVEIRHETQLNIFSQLAQTNFIKGIRTHLLTTFGHSHLKL